MLTPFIVLGLPRSRTAWLSQWLTIGDRVCRHDALAYTDSVDGLKRLLENGDGLSETSGMAIPRVLHAVAPNARYLIVRRDPSRVAASLNMMGAWGTDSIVGVGTKCLEDATAFLRPRVAMTEVQYDALNDMRVLREVWGFLRGDEFDAVRTSCMMRMRITKIDPMAGLPPRHLLAEENRLKRER